MTTSADRHAGTDPRPRRGPLVVLGAVATALVAGGWLLPLWRATLHAPQYPGGLTMRAYGHRVTGDVDEISALNHYVGMRTFDLADFPEMVLWPYVLAIAVVAVGVGLAVRRGPARMAALVHLWGTPFGVLAVVQYRLHQYGQDLDPGAALRLDPFTPLVIGPTRVWNFTTWSWPGLGLVALVLAAAVVTFGPRLLRVTARPRTATGTTVALLLAGLLVPHATAAAADDQHGPHGSGGFDATHDTHEQLVTERPQVPDHPPAGRLGDLLENVRPGQRVVVPAGTYHGAVVIDVPVVLEGRDLPLVVGDSTGTVLTIRAPGTVVRGIAVRGSGPGPTGDPAGIRVEADDVTVEDVVVEDSYVGIAVSGAAGVRLVGNTIRGRAGAVITDEAHAVERDEPGDHDPATEAGGADHAGHGPIPGDRSRGDGVWLHDVDHALVRGNVIEHTRDGVYVSFGTDALVDGNVVRHSRYAVHSMFAGHLTLVENHVHDNLSGAVLMYGGPALLLRNHVERSTSPSTGFAVLLKDVVAVEAVENLIVHNQVGIHLDGPAGAGEPSTFVANTVARNAVGVSAYPSAEAVFRANSFVDNRVQVAPRGGRLPGLTWADRGWGNHWSNYAGFERVTGRGAVPHLEGGTVDRLLARSPVLVALADTPALRLLRAVEERWGRQDPAAIDELPITRPVSPALPVSAPQPAARAIGLLFGVVLLLPALLLLAGRSGRRGVVRRSVRAVTV